MVHKIIPFATFKKLGNIVPTCFSNPSDVPEGVIEENGVQYRICVYERKVWQDWNDDFISE